MRFRTIEELQTIISLLCGSTLPARRPTMAKPPANLPESAARKPKSELNPQLSPSSVGGSTRGQKPKLLLYNEIPPWQQENDYILSIYRPTDLRVTQRLVVQLTLRG
ncbi:hypothetical protein B0H67DRAFT_362702 [Lasiosphaeris hirsuta]|uniref:Uncharacterized protein n=1 Tax=Lasiosphaeris hirsuta TaxID=260670 RepID=A0AA40DIX7_9PEZI|nr:hypothetical protein B0H67DRAFT_362702 [Lasiosphaeris hirsuta]